MLNKKSNIKYLNTFLSDNNNSLIINCVNDEIEELYKGFIRHFVKKLNINISFEEKEKVNYYESDLFNNTVIRVFKSQSINKVEELMKIKEKKIILTDYKIYKKYINKNSTLNGYEYESDIKNYIKSDLKINNDYLLFYCINNPVFLFSEISKFLINDCNYVNDKNIQKELNHILEIRKEIFSIKRSSLDIKQLYQKIKFESQYKKFNFLIY